MANVGDRDIPARQCTNTQPLASLTISEKERNGNQVLSNRLRLNHPVPGDKSKKKIITQGGCEVLDTVESCSLHNSSEYIMQQDAIILH